MGADRCDEIAARQSQFRSCAGPARPIGPILCLAAVGVIGAASLAEAQTTLPTMEVVAKKAAPKAPKRRKAAKAKAAPVPKQAPKVEKAETGTSHVDGYIAKVSATGSKTDTPLLLTPQSISVVTSDQVEDQGVQSVVEALRYTPGVSVELNSDTRYDEAYIRGFRAIQYLDGLPLPLNQFWATPRIEPYGLERIEVLKGPASFLFGQNSPGGLINMISKRPTEEAQNELELQFGSFNHLQTNFDFSGPATKDGKFLYRLTGTVRDAETVVDYTRDDVFSISPALTWRPSSGTSLTVLANYGWDKGTFGHQYLPASGTLLPNPNGRLPRSTFAGEPGWDMFSRRQWAVGYEFEHKLNEVLRFRQNLRYASVDMAMRAHRVEGFHDFNPDENIVELDDKTVDRSLTDLRADAGTLTVDNQLQAQFAIGAQQHKALVGVDYTRMTGNFTFKRAFGSPLDLYNPVYGSPIGPLAPFQDDYTEQTQIGVYVQDQIKLGNWLLTLGGRQDWVDTTTELAPDDWRVPLWKTDRLAQEDSAFTGRAGLTYVFPNGIAPYVSYATSFLPKAGSGDDGALFKPETGQQYEAGIKYQPASGNLYLAAAVFDIQQDNYTTFGGGGFLGLQTGEVRVRGFDIEAKARLTRNIDLLASYAYLDSEVTKSDNLAEVGLPIPMIPLHQASIWGKYTFTDGALAGLWLGAGVRYTGSTITADASYGLPTNTIPSYTLVDVGMAYDLGQLDKSFKGAEISLNVTNLFDDYHVAGYCDTFYCSLGEGRTVLTTLSYRW